MGRLLGSKSSKRVQGGEPNLLFIENTTLSRRTFAKSLCSQVRILSGPPIWELRKSMPTPPEALFMAHHACDPRRCGDYRRFNPTLRRTSKASGAGRYARL